MTVFQSTLPVKGATGADINWDAADDISIHAPREGSDIAHPTKTPIMNISIHAPREGSDVAQQSIRHEQTISIHAPREGSDPMRYWPKNNAELFQSTLPVKGATRHAAINGKMGGISIHAPREGSDVFNIMYSDFLAFQSTLPVKGATAPQRSSIIEDLSPCFSRTSVSRQKNY